VVSVKTKHERSMLLLEEDRGLLESCFWRGGWRWHALRVEHLGSSRLGAEGWLVCKVVDLHGHAGSSWSKVALIPALRGLLGVIIEKGRLAHGLGNILVFHCWECLC